MNSEATTKLTTKKTWIISAAYQGWPNWREQVEREVCDVRNHQVAADGADHSHEQLPEMGHQRSCTLSQGIGWFCPHDQVEGIMSWWAECAALDRHHNKRVLTDEAHEPFKASQSTPQAVHATAVTGLFNWVAIHALLFGAFMEEFKEEL